MSTSLSACASVSTCVRVYNVREGARLRAGLSCSRVRQCSGYTDSRARLNTHSSGCVAVCVLRMEGRGDHTGSWLRRGSD